MTEPMSLRMVCSRSRLAIKLTHAGVSTFIVSAGLPAEVVPGPARRGKMARMACETVVTRTNSTPFASAESISADSGTTTRFSPRRVTSCSRRPICATGRTSPPRPTSPTAARSSVDRLVAEARGHCQRKRQVGGSLADSKPAGDVDHHVLRSQRHAGASAQDSRQHHQPAAVQPIGNPARCRPDDRGCQCLHLHQHGPRALQHRRQRRAHQRPVPVRQQLPRGICDLHQSRAVHLKEGKPRLWSRSGSSRCEAGEGRSSIRPQGRAPRPPCAPARAGRRRRPPWSRARR